MCAYLCTSVTAAIPLSTAGATLPVWKNSVWQQYFLAALADKTPGLPRQGCRFQPQEIGVLPDPAGARP
ncbi:hypothetical protein WJX82_008596 [Trebouxia sp. C0006]